jgi:hypothetical protein
VSRAAANRIAIEQSDSEESRIRWRLDDRLVGIHNLFERLSKPETGMPLHALERIRLLREGATFGADPRAGLPSDQAALLDCLAEAGDYERAFVKVLYWLRGATAWKAQRLNLTKTRFYEERARVLFDFRGAMRSKGYRL